MSSKRGSEGLVMTEVTTGKRAAEAAARAAIGDRVALVAAIGEAQDRHTKAVNSATEAQNAVEEAVTAVRDAFTTATNGGGWTMKELKAMGLIPPATPRSKNSRSNGDHGTAPTQSAG